MDIGGDKAQRIDGVDATTGGVIDGGRGFAFGVGHGFQIAPGVIGIVGRMTERVGDLCQLQFARVIVSGRLSFAVFKGCQQTAAGVSIPISWSHPVRDVSICNATQCVPGECGDRFPAD
jgi:hypothetical protein